MVDNSRYIENNRVKREKIAMDIKYGKITKSELESLLENETVQSAFIGTTYTSKKPKQEWDKKYLDELSYAVVAESFNVEYLRYLYDVATYVNATQKKKVGKRVAIGIVITAVVIVAAILIIISSKNT